MPTPTRRDRMRVPDLTGPRTVTIAGSSVHLLEGGEGPAVLFLHGSGPGTTGAGAWTSTARALGSEFHAVAPDQPGFGQTPLPPGSRGGLEVWTKSAGDLMDALGFRTYAVVGHSMGGAVALALAASRPEQISRVVAVATMGAPGAGLSPDLDALWAASDDEAGARDMLRRLFFDQSFVTDDAVQTRARGIRDGAAAFKELFPPPRSRWAADLTLTAATLSQVQAPVLLVHGAQDGVTPMPAATAPLMEHLADVRLQVVDECGHAVMAERPEGFWRLLSNFLGGETL